MDEDIIKKRLISDGEGTGHEQRLNLLLKNFLRWCMDNDESHEINISMFNRLYSQATQCQFDALKTWKQNQMLLEEEQNTEHLSKNYDQAIIIAQKSLQADKEELKEAKKVLKQSIEYQMMGKLIKAQPDRKLSLQEQEKLHLELQSLNEQKRQIERKTQTRKNDFNVMMTAIAELQTKLERDADDVEEESEAMDEDVSDESLVLPTESSSHGCPLETELEARALEEGETSNSDDCISMA